MLYGGKIFKNHEYRKKSCFLRGNSPSMPNLTLSPTTHRYNLTFKIDDYGKKASKRGKLRKKGRITADPAPALLYASIPVQSAADRLDSPEAPFAEIGQVEGIVVRATAKA